MCGTCGCDGDLPPALANASRSVAVPSRHLQLEQRLLAHNDQHAAANRERFARADVRVVNLLSSPGSGKTSLLEALARVATDPAASGLARPLRQAVLVGDLATDHDARRLQAAGLTALQINTGQGCHLEADQVARALDQLEEQGTALADLDLLWIENVGNLVCPAAFDLGERLRVVLMATTEGEDKPLKYAPMFQRADLVLVSKIDLAEVVGFRADEARQALRRVAPRAPILEVSARDGRGLVPLLQVLLRPSEGPANRAGDQQASGRQASAATPAPRRP